MAASADREARRRRIVDRGNDRFALITGRTPNPSTTEFQSPPSPPRRHERAASCPPLDEDSRPKFDRSVLTHMNRYDDERLPDLRSPGHNGNGHIGPGSGQSKARPPLAKSEISSEASSGPPATESIAKARSQVSSTSPNSSVTTTSSEHGLRRNPEANITTTHPRNPILAAIDSNLILYCIEVTQPSRLQFSINVAVLVVLANIEFPVIGLWFIKRLISVMPLHIVLLTNISYVILQYLAAEERLHERAHREAAMAPTGVGSNWADQLGDALQAGILIMRVGRALFVDVAVYSAIVTCFLCFK